MDKRGKKEKPKKNNGDKLNEIFDSFMKQTIFKNKFILQTNYTPETIPHREEQIAQVASIIAPCLRKIIVIVNLFHRTAQPDYFENNFCHTIQVIDLHILFI